ncbi:hypothetical protein G6514_006931 [Epicoccum nigrum]|nr:hypothetical protein G6514_006931 [Epicoccum nigrum]
MVTTRRQSKDFEPVELSIVPRPDRKGKRKRSNTAAPALNADANAPQLPSQPSAKRTRKVKVKSTAKTGVAPEPAQPTLPAAQPSTTKIPASTKSAERKTRRARARAKEMNATKFGANQQGAKRSASVDLTMETDSSDDEPPRQIHPAASREYDVENDDADSRYTLGPRRKEKKRKPAPAIARQTAELKFEEDGLEEVDKANVAVTSINKRTAKQAEGIVSLPSTTVNDNNMAGHNTIKPSRKENNNKGQKKTSFTSGAPSKLVMFTVAEAVEALTLYKDGTMYGPAAIDPQSHQPYSPLRTGETHSYPVKGTYHLGALGRYGIDTTPTLPFALTVPLSEHSMIQTTHSASIGEPLRRGLGFATALAQRPGAPASRRPNNYCLPFGRYRGRRVDSVPISYLQSIYGTDEYYSDTKLLQAVSDLYPNGLFESAVERFTLESGGFKGKRLDEVPKSYVWGLLRKMHRGGKKGEGEGEGETRLQSALEAWERAQLDLTRD